MAWKHCIVIGLVVVAAPFIVAASEPVEVSEDGLLRASPALSEEASGWKRGADVP